MLDAYGKLSNSGIDFGHFLSKISLYLYLYIYIAAYFEKKESAISSGVPSLLK